MMEGRRNGTWRERLLLTQGGGGGMWECRETNGSRDERSTESDRVRCGVDVLCCDGSPCALRLFVCLLETAVQMWCHDASHIACSDTLFGRQMSERNQQTHINVKSDII